MSKFYLRDLVRRLDDFKAITAADAPDDDAVSYYAQVVSAYGNPSFRPSRVTHREADSIVGSCEFVNRLASQLPGVGCPVDLSHQSWSVSAGKESTLSSARFRPPSLSGSDSLPPRGFGLFTSTAVTGAGASMWDAYMAAGDSDSGENSLFPKPRVGTTLVNLTSSLRVAEIASAGQWVELITSFGSSTGDDGDVVVDWPTVSKEFDAVHISCQAALAIQGAQFELSAGRVTVPSYWDVETTLWLRWPFNAEP